MAATSDSEKSLSLRIQILNAIPSVIENCLTIAVLVTPARLDTISSSKQAAVPMIAEANIRDIWVDVKVERSREKLVVLRIPRFLKI